MIVYALVDPLSGLVRYVGQTTASARRRLQQHLASSHLRGSTHKERWIRALLAIGLKPRVRVLTTCASRAEMDEAERRHIARQRRAGADLTNATDGGSGVRPSPGHDTRTKISKALAGRPKSVTHRERLRDAGRRRVVSDQTRAKLRALKSLPRGSYSEAHRVAISRGKSGRPFVDQHGRRFETQKGAARALGLNVGHLNEVLHGKRRSVGGLFFRFIDGAGGRP